jgi:hypothetical protein
MKMLMENEIIPSAERKIQSPVHLSQNPAHLRSWVKVHLRIKIEEWEDNLT